MLYAVHTDRLIVGIGATVTDAYADADDHGAELAELDLCEISDRAAASVRNGGDCRALHWTVLRSGDEIANLAKGPFDAR